MISPSPAPTPQKPDPFFSGTVYEVKGWRRWLLIWPGALLFRLYCATLRVEIAPEDEKTLRDISTPEVCVLWHNRSFIAPYAILNYRVPGKTYCLISASKVAAWEDAIFNTIGLRSVRGSSTRRSFHAMLQLMHVMRKGNDIIISPDGPSGPRYGFKHGAVAAARMAKSPLLLIGIECRTSWRPNSWDRQMYPLPFSKLRLRALRIGNEELFGQNEEDEVICARLKEQLCSINEDYGV